MARRPPPKTDHKPAALKPTRIKMEKPSAEVKKVLEEIEDLDPHELLKRMAKGKPIVEMEKYLEQQPNGTFHEIHRHVLHYPSLTQQLTAAKECSSFFASRIAVKPIEADDLGERTQYVMSVPIVPTPEEWEQIAANQQAQLQARSEHLINSIPAPPKKTKDDDQDAIH